MTRRLRVVPDVPTLGEAVAAYWTDDATQHAVDDASEYTTRNEDDDWGDVDTERYQRRVRDLRDALRAERGER